MDEKSMTIYEKVIHVKDFHIAQGYIDFENPERGAPRIERNFEGTPLEDQDGLLWCNAADCPEYNDGICQYGSIRRKEETIELCIPGMRKKVKELEHMIKDLGYESMGEDC